MRRIASSLLLVWGLAPLPVGAVCLGSGQAQVENLMQEIGRSPSRALPQIEQAVAQIPPGDHRAAAWLSVVRAVGMGMMGRDDPLLPASVKQGEATLAADDPALLHLQISKLVGGVDGDIRFAVAALAPALARQAPNAESTVCATASMAYLLSRSGHPAEAFPLAAAAYRNSAGGHMPWAHAEAAGVLAQVVRFQADREYAVELNTEALAYFDAAGMHDLVANELAMRGWARLYGRDAALSRAAEADFVASAEAARRAGNDVAVAYAHSGLCELLVSSKRLADAAPICEAGYRAMLGSADGGTYGATTNFATYLVESGRHAEALGILNGMLKDGAEQSRSFHSYMAFDARGRARTAMGDLKGAVSDMQTAMRILRTIELDRRDRSAAVERARFHTEQLSNSLERETLEHDESRRRIWLVGGFGALVAILLTVIAYVMARHRALYRQLAFTDALTGVANRRYTETRLGEMLAHAQARKQPMTLSILDLDHFKSCNDRFGHDAGDEALRKFAAAATKAIRPGDLFGRWGGEEFLLALSDSDQDKTRQVLDRIREAASQTQLELAPEYMLRFSAGAVSTGDAEASLGTLLAAADQALYQAKAEGRNRSCFSATLPHGPLEIPAH